MSACKITVNDSEDGRRVCSIIDDGRVLVITGDSLREIMERLPKIIELDRDPIQPN